MSCHGCGSEFGIFRHERGCKKCGFSFCGKCCSKKIILKEISLKKKHSVCNPCYEKLTRNVDIIKVTTQVTPTTITQTTVKPKPAAENPFDKELRERLQKFKKDENRAAPATIVELEKRLANLKDVDPPVHSKPPATAPRPKMRTESQQADDLFKQYHEEVQIDSKRPKPEEEIAARLARLRDEPIVDQTANNQTMVEVTSDVKPLSEEISLDKLCFELTKEADSITAAANEDLSSLLNDEEITRAIQKIKEEQANESEAARLNSDENDEDEDSEEAQSVIEKLVAESALEEIENEDILGSTTNCTTNGTESETEFPWCVMCTEDASLRCLGCDEDLYCEKCFREGHDSQDIKDHKTTPFRAKKM